MALASVLVQFLRLRGGQTLWTIATGAVPSLSLLAGEPLWVAAALFWAETVLASSLLSLRVTARWYLARRRGDEPAVMRLREIGRLLGWLVGSFNVAVGVIGGTVIAIGLHNGVLVGDDATLLWTRLRALTLALGVAALYDSLLAPTGAILWLENVAAWQWSRTAVLLMAVVAAALSGMLFGERAALWAFLAVRLLTDVGALRASERERIRSGVFGPAPGEAVSVPE